MYVSREDIPQSVIESEREIYKSQVTGKPAPVMEKIVEGKLERFFSETCLLEQIFIKDPEQKLKVKDLMVEKIAKLGENIVVKRFARFQVGEKR
jgi:elongation factor Ts